MNKLKKLTLLSNLFLMVLLIQATMTPVGAIGSQDWTFESQPSSSVTDLSSGYLGYLKGIISNGEYDSTAVTWYRQIQGGGDPYNPAEEYLPTLDIALSDNPAHDDICAVTVRASNYADPYYDLDDDSENGCHDEAEVVNEGYDHSTTNFWGVKTYYPVIENKDYYFWNRYFENNAATGYHSETVYFSHQVSTWGPDPYNPTDPWEYQTVPSALGGGSDQFNSITYTYYVSGGGPFQPQSVSNSYSIPQTINFDNSIILPEINTGLSEYQLLENFTQQVQNSADLGKIRIVDVAKTPDLISYELDQNLDFTIDIVTEDTSVYGLITFEELIQIDELQNLIELYNLRIEMIEGLAFDSNDEYFTYNVDNLETIGEVLYETQGSTHGGIYAINAHISAGNIPEIMQHDVLSHIDTRAYNVHMYMNELYGISELSIHDYEVNDVFWKLGYIDNFIDRTIDQSLASDNGEIDFEDYSNFLVTIAIVSIIAAVIIRKKQN